MARQKYLWLIEKKIGRWDAWVSKGRRGPQPDEKGQMKFKGEKSNYGIDPNKFRNFKVPKGIHAGDVIKIQIWREDQIKPIDFFSPEKMVGDEFTGSMLKHISSLKRLELISADSGHDKILIILAIALMVAMGIIGVMGFIVANGGHI